MGPISPSHLPGISSDLVDLLEHVYLCGALDVCRLKGASSGGYGTYFAGMSGKMARLIPQRSEFHRIKDKQHVVCDWRDAIDISPLGVHMSSEPISKFNSIRED